MAAFALSTGTQLISSRGSGAVSASGEDALASVVFQVWNAAGGFSSIPGVSVENSGQSPTNVQYFNVLTGATIAAGTPITAAGIYAVYAPSCRVSLVTSAGTANCEAQRVYGRVF